MTPQPKTVTVCPAANFYKAECQAPFQHCGRVGICEASGEPTALATRIPLDHPLWKFIPR